MLNAPPFALISIAAIAALYLVCSPRLNNALYRPMLFHPWKIEDQPVAPPIAGVPGENVYFPSANGKVLNGWYYHNPSAKYTILFSHGNGGNVAVRTDLVQLLLQCDASVLIYDYEGYGESVGLPSVDAICQDGVGAYKYLTNVQGVSPTSLIIYGESLGTAVSAYLITKFPCKALILQSGFVSLRRIACELFPLLNIYPEWLYPQPALDTGSILSREHPPLLLLHGGVDKLIPYAHAESLYKLASEPKTLVRLDNAGHSDIYSSAPGVYKEAIKKFLSGLN